jgi:putative ABC transport system permease protein
VCLVPVMTRLLSKAYAFVTQKLFGNAASLGAHDISYSKSITSSVVLVMVALSILLSMYILTLSSANVFATGYSKESDIQIWGASHANSEYDDLREIDGVDGLFYSYYASVQLSEADHVYDLSMIPLDSSGFGILDLDHLMPGLKDNEILIDKYFAVRNDIQTGDKVTQLDKNLSFTVVGYVDSSAYTPSRNVCVIRPSFFTEYESNVPEIIHISTARDSREMKEVLKKALAGEDVYIQTTEEGIARSENSVSGILKMTWVMFGVAGLLAVVGLINNQMIGFLQRRSEFAVLYSVSMSKAQLQIMIFFQVLGTFLIGTVLGTVLSLWLTKLLNDIMFAIGLCLPIQFDMRSVLLASAGVFLLLMLTVLSPMRHLHNMHVVDEIKRE